MAESLVDIKRRITSTQKTSKITSAMRLVSGAKLSQIGDRAKNYQTYSNKVKSVVTDLVAAHLLDTSEIDSSNNDDSVINVQNLLTQRPVKKTGYLVITSDRGLVGSYNSSFLKSLIDLINEKHQSMDEVVFLTVGTVGTDFLQKRFGNVVFKYKGLSDIPSFTEADDILKTAVEMYCDGVYDELVVCYNHSVNTLVTEFTAKKMLPINGLDTENVAKENLEYIVEPNLETVLNSVLPQYAESMIYAAILDAKTAEHASSMTAMKSATDNAGNIIDSLTTKYNRARQAQITTEITEIVSGAEALQ